MNINGLNQNELKQFDDLLIKANDIQVELMYNRAEKEYNKRFEKIAMEV